MGHGRGWCCEEMPASAEPWFHLKIWSRRYREHGWAIWWNCRTWRRTEILGRSGGPSLKTSYSDAAEEDVRRYERSFRKLSRDHKGLLSHLLLKFQRLRRCIAANSFFIMSMLQAFDPPFDMSQDIDLDGHGGTERLPNGHLCTQASHYTQDCSSYLKQPVLKRPELSSCGGGCHQTPSKINNEKREISSESSCTLIMNVNTPDCNAKLVDESKDDAKFICKLDSPPRGSTPNGNISSVPNDWMETSSRLSVPLVDVDKGWDLIQNFNFCGRYLLEYQFRRGWGSQKVSILRQKHSSGFVSTNGEDGGDKRIARISFVRPVCLRSSVPDRERERERGRGRASGFACSSR
ncbi:hypothetical protein M5K25_019203 [Dendrobium thyrsiflorum]|uniref:Uncharacterized protein n=1 Tax=Dendrobium thyrsiflorum TaxID=117978 RepID=A0ABD0UL48_DENTH